MLRRIVSNADAICLAPDAGSHRMGAACALLPRRRIAMVSPRDARASLITGDLGPERSRAGDTRTSRSSVVPQAPSPGQAAAFIGGQGCDRPWSLHRALSPHERTIVRLLKSVIRR